MQPSLCWQCGNPEVCQLVCPACHTLQKPPKGFYEFFGLEEKLAIDADSLQRRYYELSREVHPDRFTLKTIDERECSLEATSILNDGYRTLRDPIRRAEYVLAQHGLQASGQERNQNVPPELLEEVFELNEALEEIRGGDETVRPQLEQAGANFRSMLAGVDDELQREFAAWDASRDNAVLSKIRSILDRRKYIQNLAAEVDKELALHRV